LIYGAWVDGTSAWLIAFYLSAALGTLALGLYLMNRYNRRRILPLEPSSH